MRDGTALGKRGLFGCYFILWHFRLLSVLFGCYLVKQCLSMFYLMFIWLFQGLNSKKMCYFNLGNKFNTMKITIKKYQGGVSTQHFSNEIKIFWSQSKKQTIFIRFLTKILPWTRKSNKKNSVENHNLQNKIK